MHNVSRYCNCRYIYFDQYLKDNYQISEIYLEKTCDYRQTLSKIRGFWREFLFQDSRKENENKNLIEIQKNGAQSQKEDEKAEQKSSCKTHHKKYILKITFLVRPNETMEISQINSLDPVRNLLRIRSDTD